MAFREACYMLPLHQLATIVNSTSEGQRCRQSVRENVNYSTMFPCKKIAKICISLVLLRKYPVIPNYAFVDFANSLQVSYVLLTIVVFIYLFHMIYFIYFLLSFSYIHGHDTFRWQCDKLHKHVFVFLMEETGEMCVILIPSSEKNK